MRATEDVLIETAQGEMRAIVARPEGEGPWPAVITFPHVGGMTDTMRLMAQRVAAGGFFCVVPDLYHRLGTIVIDPQSEDETVVAIRKLVAASVTEAGAMEDAGAVLRWLGTREDVRGPGVGTVGYGRGGGLALLAAAAFPEQVRAAASVLGFGFSREWLAKIRAPIYCAFAEDDNIIPASVPAELKAELAGLPVDARLVIYPGARHPYVFPDRTVHDPAASARDWDTIFSLYARCLA